MDDRLRVEDLPVPHTPFSTVAAGETALATAAGYVEGLSEPTARTMAADQAARVLRLILSYNANPARVARATAVKAKQMLDFRVSDAPDLVAAVHAHAAGYEHDKVERFWSQNAIPTASGGAAGDKHISSVYAAYHAAPANAVAADGALVRAVQSTLAQLLDAGFINHARDTLARGDDPLGLANQFMTNSQNLGLRFGAEGNFGAAALDLAMASILSQARDKSDRDSQDAAKAFLSMSNRVFHSLVQHQKHGYLFLSPREANLRANIGMKGDRAFYVHNKGSTRPKAFAIKVDGNGSFQGARLSEAEKRSINGALVRGGLPEGYQFLFCMMKYSPAYMKWTARATKYERKKRAIAKLKAEALTKHSGAVGKAATKFMSASMHVIENAGRRRRQKRVVGQPGCITTA